MAKDRKDDLMTDCKNSIDAMNDKWGFKCETNWLEKLTKDELENFANFLDDLWREVS